MRRWTLEEDVQLRAAILLGHTTRTAQKLFHDRSRHSLISRSQRLSLSFGPVKELPPNSDERARARERRRWAEVRSVAPQKGTTSWDDKLFEPYAERKARLAAERARA